MADTWVFTRVQEKAAAATRQCRAMHIMAALLILIYGLQYLFAESLSWIYLLALLPPPLLIAFFSIFKPDLIILPHNNRIFRILESGFLLMGAMHFLQEDHIAPTLLFCFASALMATLLWMESRIFSPQYIRFSEAGIILELPLKTRQLPWSEIDGVLFRNHYLSFIFASGETRQYRVETDLTADQLLQFQAWCREKIQAA